MTNRAERYAARARALGERPDVERWIARLGRVLKDAPPDIWLFGGGGGNLYVMAAGEHPGDDRDEQGSVDPAGVLATFTYPHTDGGDW